MKQILALFTLLLLIGCFKLGSRSLPPPAKAGDRNAKLVRALVPYASELAWKRSPYWRLMDTSWPWYLIVANDGTACALWENVVFLPRETDYYVCPTQWRLARP